MVARDINEDFPTPGDSITLQLDPSLYTQASEDLMRQRGIIQAGETVTSSLERTVGALVELDDELAGGRDEQFVHTVVDYVNDGTIVFGTPVMTNAGRPEAITAACTVLPVEVEQGRVNLQRFYADSEAALDKAVGTGYDLSGLERPAEALLELNGALDDINTRLLQHNQRPVASMATLRADHPGIVEFIRTKREADFSKWRFNLSVFLTEDLFEAASSGQPWELKDSDGKVVDTINADELLTQIADCAHYCGEPGILFKDRIDSDNPTPQWEYKSTAPCAEVAMAEGEACQFSYINVAELVSADGAFDQEKFGSAVRTMTRLLDASVEHTVRNSHSFSLPLVEQKRRIGVGITGFADLLINLKMPYDAPDASHLAAQISEALDFHSKAESVTLAQQRGTFPAYGLSRFLDTEWVRRKMPYSTGAVSPDQWEALFAEMEQHGIRHASTTAMPPTGTSSAIVGSSKSLEPLFALTDHHGVVSRVVREALSRSDNPGIREVLGHITVAKAAMLDSEALDLVPYLRTARQVDSQAHLDVQAGFQSFLDESLAKTINLDNSATVGDVKAALWSAYTSRLKGITVFRDNCLAERQGGKSVG